MSEETEFLGRLSAEDLQALKARANSSRIWGTCGVTTMRVGASSLWVAACFPALMTKGTPRTRARRTATMIVGVFMVGV